MFVSVALCLIMEVQSQLKSSEMTTDYYFLVHSVFLHAKAELCHGCTNGEGPQSTIW